MSDFKSFIGHSSTAESMSIPENVWKKIVAEVNGTSSFFSQCNSVKVEEKDFNYTINIQAQDLKNFVTLAAQALANDIDKRLAAKQSSLQVESLCEHSHVCTSIYGMIQFVPHTDTTCWYLNSFVGLEWAKVLTKITNFPIVYCEWLPSVVILADLKTTYRLEYANSSAKWVGNEIEIAAYLKGTISRSVALLK